MSTIHDLGTPALLLDIDVLEANLKRMSERCKELGVRLRPHVKTHKCLEVALAQRALGAQGITVSTLEEARVFADGGFDDITWAFPVIPGRLQEAAELAARVRLGVVVDSQVAVDGLIGTGAPFRVWIKIDCGYGRAGVDPASALPRELAGRVPKMIVANSCSKNFGLYRDRVGALFVVTADSDARDVVQSQANNVVRTMYSMPPDHGAAVVAMILNDNKLREDWIDELTAMRERLREMRQLLHDALREAAPDHDFSHLVRAKGMFCFLGVSPEQVGRLKKEHSVYMVDSSRINIAGITADNVGHIARSVAAVL